VIPHEPFLKTAGSYSQRGGGGKKFRNRIESGGTLRGLGKEGCGSSVFAGLAGADVSAAHPPTIAAVGTLASGVCWRATVGQKKREGGTGQGKGGGSLGLPESICFVGWELGCWLVSGSVKDLGKRTVKCG